MQHVHFTTTIREPWNKVHNDLTVFERQVLEPARHTVAPWFFMPPTTVSDRNFYRADVPSLAFLITAV
jgi:hypothetical protein